MSYITPVVLERIMIAIKRPVFSSLVALAAFGLWTSACGETPRSIAADETEIVAVDPQVSTPVASADGWMVGGLQDAGLDAAAMNALSMSIRDGTLENVHAILVEHDGRLVYEAYFEGTDQRWGRPIGHVVFDHETLHDLRSVTKSVTSALLGIALGGDYEAALAKPITDYFPDLADHFSEGLEQVTLHHVLTMTAGLEWNEMSVSYADRDNDERRLYRTEGPLAIVLSRPLRDEPGERWYYNGGLTQLLAGIIERRTGKPVDRYAEEVLFGPLGITDYEWLGSSLWPDGASPSAASGLRLRARDLAKIGSVFLHGGRWQGKQIVPADWVALSTRRHVEEIRWSGGGVYGYGFMWYPGQAKGDPDYRVIRAMGYGQQRIFVVPDQKLVITVFAGRYGRGSFSVGEEIRRRIVAAFQAGP